MCECLSPERELRSFSFLILAPPNPRTAGTHICPISRTKVPCFSHEVKKSWGRQIGSLLASGNLHPLCPAHSLWGPVCYNCHRCLAPWPALAGLPSLEDLFPILRTSHPFHWSFTCYHGQLFPCFCSEKISGKLSTSPDSLPCHPIEPSQVKVSNELLRSRTRLCHDWVKSYPCSGHMAMKTAPPCLAPAFKPPLKAPATAAHPPLDIIHIKMLPESVFC